MIPSRTDLSQICITMEDFWARDGRFRENRTGPNTKQRSLTEKCFTVKFAAHFSSLWRVALHRS
jgi:hypothetical protein